MSRPIIPASPEAEAGKGRLPLYLDPADIAFLADEWRRTPQDLPAPEKDRWARIAFRGMACLHKHSIPYSPRFRDEAELYCLKGTSTNSAQGKEPDRGNVAGG